MRIGVDFDGVISDPSSLKMRYAQEFWGITLKPEECTTSKASIIVANSIKGFGSSFIKKYGWNGRAEYTHLIRLLESGPALLKSKLIPNCNDVLQTLIDAGHKIVIITTFESDNSDWAYKFLKRFKVPYHHLVCVPYKKGNNEIKKLTKRDVVNKLKIGAFIDDSYYNMENLSGCGIPLYLFDQPWNRHESIRHPDVVRVNGWTDFYVRLQNHMKMSQKKVA